MTTRCRHPGLKSSETGALARGASPGLVFGAVEVVAEPETAALILTGVPATVIRHRAGGRRVGSRPTPAQAATCPQAALESGPPFHYKCTVPTKVVAVANQKGGVGKTTTAVNLAACLAAVGRRILLFDLDPQANATSGLGLEKIEGASAYRPLLGEGNLLEKIQRTAFDRLEVIPSEVDLCGADIELPRVENHLLRLAGALQPVLDSQRFELVIVDCPPSLGILTLNAFAASDGLLVPLQCEYYALEGISMLNRILTQLRDNGVNPRLELLGVVMTMYDGRTKLANQVVSEVREHFGERVFETMIPRSTRLAEAPSFGKPIIHYDKYSSGAAAYELLAQEISSRLGLESNTAGNNGSASAPETPAAVATPGA
jgi:chromosome partitioning protein